MFTVLRQSRSSNRPSRSGANDHVIGFLNDVIQQLGLLNVETLHGRAEELALDHAGQFDIVVARAVAPLERLVPWAIPFVRPGGVLLALKGERWPEELRAAAPVMARLGLRVVATPSTDDTGADDPAKPRVVSIGRPTR